MYAYDIATGTKISELPALADLTVDPFGPVRQPGGLTADRRVVDAYLGVAELA